MNMHVPLAHVRLATVPVPQQACPAPPHASQVVPPPPAMNAHCAPVSQVPPRPPQHGPPTAPQATHIRLAPVPVHSPPVWQAPPVQQALPTAPQAMHVRVATVAPAQASPVPHGAVVPAQQA